MPITEEQREARKLAIGSSDMAKVLGVSRWGNAHDVYLEKTDQLEPQQDDEGYKSAGNRFEPAVLEFAAEHLGPIDVNVTFTAPELHLAANVDAVVIDAKEPIDAKTAGLFGPLVDDWGDHGTDQVPADVIVQGHVHMLCMEAAGFATPSVCHIATFLGGRGFGLYKIARHKAMDKAIRDAAVKFWTEHVVPRVPPTDCYPALDVVKRVRREPNKVARIDPALVQAWLDAKEAERAAKKDAEAAQARILAEAGDAEAMDFGDDAKWLTYYETERAGLDTKILKANHPALAAEYATVTRYRTLRHSKRPA